MMCRQSYSSRQICCFQINPWRRTHGSFKEKELKWQNSTCNSQERTKAHMGERICLRPNRARMNPSSSLCSLAGYCKSIEHVEAVVTAMGTPSINSTASSSPFIPDDRSKWRCLPQHTRIYYVKIIKYYQYNTPRPFLTRQKVLILLSYKTFSSLVNRNHTTQPAAVILRRCYPRAI